jgi:hypothetical protein
LRHGAGFAEEDEAALRGAGVGGDAAGSSEEELLVGFIDLLLERMP